MTESFFPSRACRLSGGSRPVPSRRRGVTLTELMIAMAVITIGVIGGMGAFKYINVALAQSRLKTIATNLAQERMEVLKNMSYFQLRVTTAPAVSSGYSPAFVYDTNNYPPETITLWGMPPFTRSVNVDYAYVSGNTVSTVTYTASDTGMKRITVYVTWTDRGAGRKVEISSYYQNPAAATLSAGFRGTVTEAGLPSRGVLVQVVGTPKWRGHTDATGQYSFQVAPGTYTLIASSAGYFSQITPQGLHVPDGVFVSRNFSIVRRGSGTIASDSLYSSNPGLVISQVVASTVQAGGFDAQYIELFNATGRPVNIGSSSFDRAIRLNYTSRYESQLCADIPLIYVSTFVPAGRYYLIANTPSFTVGGVTLDADAYYTNTANSACAVSAPTGFVWAPPASRPILMHERSGTVWLTDNSGGIIDAAGWSNGANIPDNCETACIPTPDGLKRGDQIVRFSLPCSPGAVYGRAYDSGSNRDDFYYNPGAAAAGLPHRPFNRAFGAHAILSGVPAVGAYILSEDDTSPAVRSSTGALAGAQGQICQISSFTLAGVSTGTWRLTAAHGSRMAVVSGVAVVQNAVTRVQNAVTVPPWPAAGFHYTAIASTYTGGLVTGHVYGVGPEYWTPLPGRVVCSSDGNSVLTDSRGWYFLPVSTGAAVITANCGSADGNYGTANVVVTVSQGAIVDVPDLRIARGGYIRGYVTSGTGALPNIPVRASNGGVVYDDTTDSTGYFHIFAATSSVAYAVEPDLDPLQSYFSAPNMPLTATVTAAGATVFAGTITVVGAMGAISGSVSFQGRPITTGVLVVASTAAVADPPPAVHASTAAAGIIYYSASSRSDGVYTLEVRSSTSAAYHLRAFYPVVNERTGTVSYTSKTDSGIFVPAGGTVSGRNFSWP